MTFGAALSLTSDSGAALDQALEDAIGQAGGRPDLVLVFASPHHGGAIEDVAERLRHATVPSGTSLGCIAEGVIAGAAEAEEEPALAVWVACLPGRPCDSSHLRATPVRDGVAISGWRVPDDPVGTIMIADPFTFPAGSFVSALEDSHPKMPVVGGLASGGRGAGSARLILDGRVYDSGAVTLAFGSGVQFSSLVSQGCRPVGAPAVVTAATDEEITRIGGKPALEFLQDLVDELPDDERLLVRQGLQLGIVVDEYRMEFERGDFLVRPVVGADPEEGSLAIGEPVSVGRTVQFQVRDPVSADEDLRMLLADQGTAEGVLLFTCNGRGRRFFGVPHHDVSLVREALRPSALAGFFAAGELGPVGGTNFLHGYTATLARIGSA